MLAIALAPISALVTYLFSCIDDQYWKGKLTLLQTRTCYPAYENEVSINVAMYILP